MSLPQIPDADSRQVRDFLNRVENELGIIQAPIGRIVLEESFTPRSGQRIIGHGPRVTEFVRHPSFTAGPCIHVTDGNFFSLEEISVDGNKWHIKQGDVEDPCVRIWGYAFRLRNILIRDCPAGGFWSGWRDGPAWDEDPSNTQMEAYIDGLSIMYSDGTPVFDGPHDSQIHNLLVAMSCHRNKEVIPGTSTFVVGSNAGGTQVGLAHLWGDSPEWCLTIWAPGCWSNLTLDDAAMGLVKVLSNQVSIDGVGLQYHREPLIGMQIGADDLPVTGGRFDLRFVDVALGVDFVNDTGNNISLTLPQDATYYRGKPAVQTRLEVQRTTRAVV